jgi:hypothetical protein
MSPVLCLSVREWCLVEWGRSQDKIEIRILFFMSLVGDGSLLVQSGTTLGVSDDARIPAPSQPPADQRPSPKAVFTSSLNHRDSNILYFPYLRLIRLNFIDLPSTAHIHSHRHPPPICRLWPASSSSEATSRCKWLPLPHQSCPATEARAPDQDLEPAWKQAER